MTLDKKQDIDQRLHPRNRNREQYDLNALVQHYPKLEKFIIKNKLGLKSLNFSNPKAVRLLNKAILHHYYGIENWDFPQNNLCPAIPGRADYIHYVADLLSKSNKGVIPKGKSITCYDIGVGASCIYPIIGVVEYQWKFIASDTDSNSIKSANTIAKFNSSLNNKIRCRHQKNSTHIFKGIIKSDELIDVSICNPPFHASAEEARKSSYRKVKNLSGFNAKKPPRNFAGISNELIYEGGEINFISNMISESKDYAKNCLWFTTMVSKQSNLDDINRTLEKVGVSRTETIDMGTGNKTTRIVAWTFLSEKEQISWAKERWNNKASAK